MRDTRRTRLVLAVLLLVSLTLITLDLRGGEDSPVDGPRGVVGAVFGQVERAAAAVVRPVAGAVEAVGSIGRHQRRIDELEEENADLREQLRTIPFDQARVDQLDRMLALAGKGRYRVVPAEVIAVGSGQGFARTATIDAGTDDGVDVDMTVINGDGLVGRVIRASGRTATVLLAIDPTSTVGARLEGDGELGLLEGRGDDTMQLELMSAQKQVEEGARLVTFGSQGGTPFVAGVPIGEVVSARGTPGGLTRLADVEPYVNFTALGVVGVVVRNPREDPRDSVLPPRPTTTATATADAPGDGAATGSATPEAGSTGTGTPRP